MGTARTEAPLPESALITALFSIGVLLVTVSYSLKSEGFDNSPL